MREKDASIAELPEERNPIFYVYPVCMGISFVLALVWSSSSFFERIPIVALMGNLAGGMLILTGGIYCMYHVEKYIDINTVEDSQLLKHPIFVHNLIMCIVSVFGMILYFIPVWVLFDLHKNSVEDEPVILYCCCVDVYRYLKASRKSEVMTHEFQVVQIM
uniref:Uncharacterized protein n=1 Tax=Trichogramma kaykai TaxID=54128 RepID=A0ABD2XKX8_9HYME